MTGTTHITGVGTIAVPVTDQDRALEFYVGRLGFETRRDLPFGEARWIEEAPPMFAVRDPDGNTLILVEEA